MALPVIGPAQVHSNRLSKKLVRGLHKRAVRAAQRQYGPLLEADRANLSGIGAEYGNLASSAAGSVDATKQGLAGLLQNLGNSNLEGPYKGQVAQELRLRQADAQSSLPFLLAGVNEEKSKALREGQQTLVQDRGELLSHAGSAFNTLLGEAHGHGAQYLKEQEDRQRTAKHNKAKAENEADQKNAGGGKYDPLKLQNAKLTLKETLREWVKNPTGEWEEGKGEVPLHEFQPLKSNADWERFARELTENGDGFGLAEANFIINKFRAEAKDKKQHPQGYLHR